MGFNKMLFGKENKDIMKVTYILICFSILFYLTADIGTQFNTGGSDSATHYYSVPRPDPSRQIDYFDHVEQRFRYMDERKPPTQVKSPEPRVVHRKSRRHQLFDKLMDEVRDDIKDDLMMEMDVWE
jgi:hypothetical protein